MEQLERSVKTVGLLKDESERHTGASTEMDRFGGTRTVGLLKDESERHTGASTEMDRFGGTR